MRDIAVITGASSGIGKEFVLQIEKNNSIEEIWLISKDAGRLEEVSKLISKETKIIPMDLTNSNDFEKYKQELQESNPNIKLLINCAGFGKFDHEENINTNTKINMIDLNIKAYVSMIDLSLPYMKENSGIINVASNAAFQPIPYINIYGATKSFVLSYSRALNMELKYRKIRVLTVCPFWTKTNFFNRAIDEEKKKVVIKYVAMYEAKDVAKKALNDYYNSKKDMSVYGFMNNFQRILTKILPHSLVMRVWMKQQKLDGTPGIRKV